VGLARTLISQGFRLGESFSTASQPAKTLVIGYYGLRGQFVKLKKKLICPQCKPKNSSVLQKLRKIG
jgi:hypothetical protein